MGTMSGRIYITVGFAFACSACCVFGVSYVVGDGWAALPLWAECLLSVVGIIPFGAALLCADAALSRLAGRTPSSLLTRLATWPPLRRVQHLSLPTLMAIMLLCWLPWVLANLPGGTYWDTYWQMWQVYPEAHPVPLIQWAPVRDATLTDAWLVDHHPVLTTLLYGGAAWASDQLTGTWMMGVFVLAGIQVLAYAALFTRAVGCFRAWGVPGPLRALAFALFCLLPSFPVWADCVVKDSTFGLFFFPWFMQLANALRTRGASLTNRRALVGMLVLTLLMCLTKKTGVFVVVATAVAGCWAFRKQPRALGAFALQGVSCVLMMAALLPCVVFPLANIVPGGRQEALGPLFQQTARYAQAHDLTDEEAAIVDAVVDVSRVRHHYDSDFQDAVKFYYRVDASSEDLMRYLGLWARQGLQDPEAYAAAALAVAGEYLAPTTYLNLRMVTVDTKLGEEDRPVLWNPPELDGLRNGLDAAYAAVASVPVVNLPFLTVTYVLWLPCAVAFFLVRRRLRGGLLFVPLAVVVAFCVLAPVFDARYAWPMLLAAPVLLTWTGTPYAEGMCSRDAARHSERMRKARTSSSEMRAPSANTSAFASSSIVRTQPSCIWQMPPSFAGSGSNHVTSTRGCSANLARTIASVRSSSSRSASPNAGRCST